MELIDFISSLFGTGARSIKDGIKYLGFQLKACGYSKSNWLWILDKYYKRISNWEFKSLSMASRVILAQSVLVQLAVYWAHLFYIPASIIHMMSRIMANFIWGGESEKRKYHLSKLSDISLPKKSGGWGLLDLSTFGKALICKSLWRGIFGDGAWSMIIKKKYMANKDIIFWFRRGKIGASYGSAI